ncbi:Short transient receptor putative channel 3 [Bulinus truncatus]|nr:Short transient receptor putative channel 3 [Bulinus truncatus]
MALGAKILQFPVVKFSCHAVSFLLFLALIIVSTWESSQSVSKNITLGTTYNLTLKYRYSELMKRCDDKLYGDDFPLRPSQPSVTDILLTFWIVGILCQECTQLHMSGFREHISLYNMLDFLLLCAYITTMSLRYWTMAKFHQAEDLLRAGSETCADIRSIYWLNTDRIRWYPTDPINVSESLFALANIMSFFRISYLLPANEVLGPLQISLGRMLKDVAKFGALFLLVIFAFMVGLHNLYWYYSERVNIELNTTVHPTEVKAEKHFGDVMATFRTVFWTLFGRGERTAVELGDDYENITEDIGYFIYGAYNVTMVTVLLNMLIAMMTRSFTRIAEDSDREWKFARSLLYMDYIGHGSTLPTPLNLLTIPKVIFKFMTEDKDEKQFSAQDSVVIEPDESSILTIFPTFKKDVKEKTLGRIIQNELRTMSTRLDEEKSEDPGTFERSPNFTRHLRLVGMLEESEKLTYQQTMQRIVQRYIFDIQREAEVTEDDFEEIKKDISRFRYDIDNQMSLSSNVQDELKQRIVDMKNEFQKLMQEVNQVDASQEQAK